MKKAGITLVMVAVLVALAGWLVPAGANPPPPNPNQVEYWCPTGGIKYEDPATPFVVPAPPEGFVWTLLVLKAGNEETSVENENETFPNPVVGQSYERSDDKDISHAILCYAVVTTTTTTPTTLATTTVPTTIATTTTQGDEEPTTTTTMPTTTTTVCEGEDENGRPCVTTTTAPTTTTTIPTTTTAPTTTLPPGCISLCGGPTTAPTTTIPTTVTVPFTTAPPTPTTTPVTTAPAPPTTAPAVPVDDELPVTGVNPVRATLLGLFLSVIGLVLWGFAERWTRNA